MQTGIFCRGVLLGVMDRPFSYFDKKTNETKHGIAHLMGVERQFTGQFGELRTITESLRIPDELFKNPSFIRSIHESIGAMIEVTLSGYQDYPDRRHFIAKDAQIYVCGTHIKAA
jgi:hypothetical protein